MKKNRFINAVITLALTCSSLSFAGDLADTELRELASARKALQQGENARALELLESLYENHPLQDEIANNYAVALFNNGKTAEAGIVLQGYLQSHDDVGIAATNLFDVYDFLAAESYALLSGAEAEAPELKVASTKPERNPNTNKPDVSQVPAISSETASTIDEDTPDATEITIRLRAYISAWSNGDADGYLSFYVPDESPIRGIGFQRWREERLRRIFPERNISIDIDDLKILSVSDSQAIAVFTQNYRAKNYSDTSIKQLTWQKRGGEWLIRHELAISN